MQKGNGVPYAIVEHSQGNLPRPIKDWPCGFLLKVYFYCNAWNSKFKALRLPETSIPFDSRLYGWNWGFKLIMLRNVNKIFSQ